MTASLVDKNFRNGMAYAIPFLCTRTYLSYLMMWELIIVHFCGKLVTVQSLDSYKKGYNKTWKI